MEAFAVLLVLAFLATPFVALGLVVGARKRLREAEERIEALRAEDGALGDRLLSLRRELRDLSERLAPAEAGARRDDDTEELPVVPGEEAPPVPPPGLVVPPPAPPPPRHRPSHRGRSRHRSRRRRSSRSPRRFRSTSRPSSLPSFRHSRQSRRPPRPRLLSGLLRSRPAPRSTGKGSSG